MTTGGVILAGGLSTRMRQPKAWITIDGVTLLEQAVTLLGKAVTPVVIAAAAGQTLPVETNVVRDAVPHRGPLGGMLAGMEALTVCDAVFVMAVDLPNLTIDIVQNIILTLQNHPAAAAVVPRVNGQPQPLAAGYRLQVLPKLQSQLQQGRLAVWELLELLNVKWIDDLPESSFRNLNTPADL